MYRHQKLLEGTSFHILVTAVSKSPSVLGSIEAGKAESVAKLSGVSWANQNPKVFTFSTLFTFKSVLFRMYTIHWRPYLQHLLVYFSTKNVYPSGSGRGAANKSMAFSSGGIQKG